MTFGLSMLPYGIRSAFIGFIAGIPCGAGFSLLMNGATMWRHEYEKISRKSS